MNKIQKQTSVYQPSSTQQIQSFTAIQYEYIYLKGSVIGGATVFYRITPWRLDPDLPILVIEQCPASSGIFLFCQQDRMNQ